VLASASSGRSLLATTRLFADTVGSNRHPLETSTVSKPIRRVLNFTDLDDAARDAESLLAGGCDRAGNWNLAQVCGHLTDWMRYPLDGYPHQPAPVRPILWLMKHAFGRRQFQKILTSGAMPIGGPTFRETIPALDADESAAVARFRDAVARFKAHNGPFQPSPLFGEFDRDTATRLQLIHCAHHLSFLVPKR
jgi:Protein of unknown function (DUF1569)